MLSRYLIAAAAFATCTLHAQQSVILIRHAELGDASGVDAKSVPLSSEGQARAQRLAKMLERSGVAAVYATDYLRTRVKIDKTDFGNVFIVTPKADSAPVLLRLRY